MFIKRLRFTNFKSFDTLDINLSKLNIVIGANASGKSNLVTIFEFLQNISVYGLSNAISMGGGGEYLRNTKLGTAHDLSLSITYDPGIQYVVQGKRGSFFGTKIREASYEFSLHFQRGRRGFKILKDTLSLVFDFVNLERGKKDWNETDSLGSGSATLISESGHFRIATDIPEDLKKYTKNIFPLSNYGGQKFPQEALLLESPFYELAHQFGNPIGDVTIYDFDPKLPKRAVSISGKMELEGNGSNLSIALMRIVQDREQKRKFLNLIGDLLPFVDDIKVQKFADKSLLFTLREKYAEQFPYLPASFLSDGTVNVASLIIALYFDQKPLLIIEEPERNVHPRLMAKVINMLEEVSQKRQIIVTTHNPEIVRYASLESLLLISRDEKGFSRLSRPSENEQVKLFLENQMGIADLYIQDLLGGIK